MSARLEDLEVAKLRVINFRVALSEDKIAEYMEVMRVDAQQEPPGGVDTKRMPAPDVLFDGTEHWLWDGDHRVTAATRLKQRTITCRVEHGTQSEAKIKALGANSAHGLPRSNADKTRVVLEALIDPDISTHTQQEIADICKVSQKTVSNYAVELSNLLSSGATDLDTLRQSGHLVATYSTLTEAARKKSSVLVEHAQLSPAAQDGWEHIAPASLDQKRLIAVQRAMSKAFANMPGDDITPAEIKAYIASLTPDIRETMQSQIRTLMKFWLEVFREFERAADKAEAKERAHA